MKGLLETLDGALERESEDEVVTIEMEEEFEHSLGIGFRSYKTRINARSKIFEN